MKILYNFIIALYNIISYSIWIIIQIFISSHVMLKGMIFVKKTLPSIIAVNTSDYVLTKFQKSILTCSISITPGTLSVLWKNDHTLIVHQVFKNAFDKKSQQNLLNRITKILVKNA